MGQALAAAGLAEAEAEADGGGIGVLIGAWADFGKKLDNIAKGAHSGDPKPVRRPKLWGSVKTDGSTPFAIPLQSDYQPSTGFIWNVRAVGVFGVADAHTAIPGSYEVYAGAMVNTQGSTEPVAGHVVDVIAVSGTIPAPSPGMFTYTGDVFWVRPTETIYALVYGVAANTTLALVAMVEEFLLRDVERLVA